MSVIFFVSGYKFRLETHKFNKKKLPSPISLPLYRVGADD